MRFEKAVEEFLKGVHFAKLATLNKSGSPQLTPVWYMYDDGKLIVNTAAGRVKHGNILRDPRVALLIDEGYKYVTISGRARVAKERDGHKDIETLAIMYTGEERGRKAARERYSKEERVSIEIIPRRVFSDL
ncbi:MAG: PPOX class F420-dependent oxidoreductase [Nitrososphaerales archaeon]|nr:PPOX class F420-dependent oxidoreductase [Nitrososphaerales archaeon]